MLSLLSLLQTGRRWSAGDLARALNTSPRTLRRDLQHLHDLGYPVDSTRGPGGHYRLTNGTALPPLMLDDNEAVAAVLGLRIVSSGGAGLDVDRLAADSALDKLRRMLPARLRKQTDQILTAVTIPDEATPLPDPELFRTIAAATHSHRRLTITHRGRGGATTRVVEPIQLIRRHPRWYLLAWDTGRGDWRTFRLDRVADARAKAETFRPRPAPADDLAGYLDERFRAPLHRVTVVLHVDADLAASRLYRIDGALEPLGPDRTRYVADVDSYEWLATVLVLAGVEFTVEGPDGFAEYLASAAERLARASR